MAWRWTSHDVIVACTMLHNVCLGNDDVLPVDEEDLDEPAGGDRILETARGSALCDYIADVLSVLQERIPDNDYCI